MAYLTLDPEGADALLISVPTIDQAKRVYARDGRKSGRIVGGGDFCRLEGCTGVRISVRWPDGKLTRPCSKGLKRRKDGRSEERRVGKECRL